MNMTNPHMEQIIESHQSWGAQFRILINDQLSIGAVGQARIDDAHQCDLGQMLDRGAIQFGNPMLLGITRDLHNTFHGIAALIVRSRDDGADPKEIAQYLSDLDQLSIQLIRLLRQATYVSD